MPTTSSYFSAHQSRSAAGRVNDGLHVQLLWRRHDDEVTVIVDDPAIGVTFAGSVPRERALETFYQLFE